MQELCKENIEKIIILEQDMKLVKHQLEGIEQEQKILYEMSSNLKLLAEHNKYQNIKIDEQGVAIKEIKQEVSLIKTKPLHEVKDNQNKVVLAIICTVVTLLLTYLFNRILM